MIRLLQMLFMGHVHRWKTIEKTNLSTMDGDKVAATGARYIQQCETCGIVKKRDLI